jgi:hypothetical protein
MIKVHFRKKTLLGSITLRTLHLINPVSPLRTLADLREIVLSVSELWGIMAGAITTLALSSAPSQVIFSPCLI